MKVKIMLKARSAEASREFYVNELRLFTAPPVQPEWNLCMLRSTQNSDLSIHLAGYYGEPTKSPLFSLEVDNCECELARLKKIVFASGGRIVPGDSGELSVFEYPGGANFMMEDPAGNRFLLAEDYTKYAEE